MSEPENFSNRWNRLQGTPRFRYHLHAACVPSEFTLEIATIFSALPGPVFRSCLAQLRAPSRVRLVGGARCGARDLVSRNTGLRVVSDHRPRRRKTGLP